MKIDPYMQRQKCRPVTLVSGNIRYMQNADTRRGYLDRRRPMTVPPIISGLGKSTNFKFGDLSGYFFGNVEDKASNIIWRYATPCWPVTDCKMDDLE